MKVIWMPTAKAEMLSTARYIRKEFGISARIAFMERVHQANTMLAYDPYIGKKEPLLEDLNNEYRSYVLNKINKIIYRIFDNHIKVYDFWDVRREPAALKESLQ